jgi:NADP-dependent 3-hydroxy acid dehydrogenase YdfG
VLPAGLAAISRLWDSHHRAMGMTAKIALISGANWGIGFETARHLGSQGMTVLAGARDE